MIVVERFVEMVDCSDSVMGMMIVTQMASYSKLQIFQELGSYMATKIILQFCCICFLTYVIDKYLQ